MAVGENSISIAKIRLNEKLIRIIFELGLGEMPSANAFVEYIAEKYALPKSSVWYSLKRLKELGILLMGDKNNKSSLALTEKGKLIIRNQTVLINNSQKVVKETSSAYQVYNRQSNYKRQYDGMELLKDRGF